MKLVLKQLSPKDFEDWKLFRKPTIWSDLLGNPARGPIPDGAVDYSKADLREALFIEQQGLCCYCNQAVQDDALDTAIDHIAPKEGTTNQHLLFDYQNLSLSCKGNEKTPKPRELHCDAEKGNGVLPITHLNPRCEAEIIYAGDGGVSGSTGDAIATIKCLNLHIIKLNNLREEAIAVYLYEDLAKTILISREDAENVLGQLESNPIKMMLLS